MKKPEKAPDWRKILQNKNKEVMDLFTSPKAKKIITRANKEYLYWDRFKYINLPTETNHEIAWAYLKLMRGTQGKKTPVKDIEHLSFHYWLPEIILRELHYIDQHAGGQILMDDSSMHSGEKERYLINSIMEEAIASSQLEGAATTRKKAKDLLRSGRKPKSRAEQMIVNNYITIRNIKKIIDKPLTPELLKDLQASMTKDTLDDNDASGRFRKENEVIHVVDNTEGIVLFEPPPAKEIDTRIKRLCVYANDQQKQEFTHPIIKAVILHFWLAYIHPFVDGNGRTARALFYWYVLKNKYWLFEFAVENYFG
jgi:fido (protein-threonine AMPylation protein)